MASTEQGLGRRSALGSLNAAAPQTHDPGAGKVLRGGRLLPIDRIEPDPDQPRKSFDPNKHQDLVRSIRDNGILQNLRVRAWEDTDHTTRYIIINGERRWRAAPEAGLYEVPCIVVEVDDPRERQIQQIVENAHREDLKPSEVLASVQKLVAMGMKPLEIAERLNRDQSTISHYLSVGAHQDLVEQVDKLGITKATIKAGERSRAAGSTRGRKPRVDKAENSTAWGNTTREDHFTEQPSSTRANQSQALVVVEPERQAAYDNAPSMTGLTLVVAHRATTAEEWVHSLEAWLTALSTPAGQAWIPALPDTLRNEVAGKLATLLRLVDPVTVSDTE